MTQDIGEHLQKLTSRKGRYWLRDSREGSVETGNEDLPFRSVNQSQSYASDRTTTHESVVVSIPNVAALNAKAAGIVDTTASDVAAMQQRSAPGYKVAENTRIVAPLPNLHQAPPPPKAETIARAAQQLAAMAPIVAKTTQMDANASAIQAATQQPSIAYSEIEVQELPVLPLPTVEVAPAPPVSTEPLPKSDDAVDAARSSQSKSSSDSIGKIADEIVAKHPVASSSVIMIAGSQASLHADETCARVAAELAGRKLGRVLLVDSDFVGRRLTKASGMNSQGGLSEIINIALPWEKAILKSGSSKLDFMAAGSCPHKRWTPKETLRQAIAEIRCEYQFVCVSVGDAHSSAGALWSQMSDGAFLVVSATHSSDSIAESAVEHLRENGARLAGCIVADVPADKMMA